MLDGRTIATLTARGYEIPNQEQPSFLRKLFCMHWWVFVEYMDKVPTPGGGFLHTGSGHVCKKCNAERF